MRIKRGQLTLTSLLSQSILKCERSTAHRGFLRRGVIGRGIRHRLIETGRRFNPSRAPVALDKPLVLVYIASSNVLPLGALARTNTLCAAPFAYDIVTCAPVPI